MQVIPDHELQTQDLLCLWGKKHTVLLEGAINT